MPSSCKDIRAALAQCLQDSDCIMVQRHKASDCLREPLVETLPLKCQQLKRAYGECRRGMIDMRKRFRGNEPATLQQIKSTECDGQGYQLYAGKSAFASGQMVTDGNEKPAADWREIENEKYRQEQAAKEAGATGGGSGR